MIKDWDIESQLDKWVKEVCSAIGIPEKKVVVEWVWFPMSTHVLVPPPSKSRSRSKDSQSVESLLGHFDPVNSFNMFQYVSIFKTCWNRQQNVQLLPAKPAEEQALHSSHTALLEAPSPKLRWFGGAGVARAISLRHPKTAIAVRKIQKIRTWCLVYQYIYMRIYNWL